MKKELTYRYQNTSNGEDAFSMAMKALDRAERENVFPVKVDFKFDNEFRKIQGKGRGFEISLEFFDKELDLFLDLSFVLKPAKRKILSSIENELCKFI